MKKVILLTALLSLNVFGAEKTSKDEAAPDASVFRQQIKGNLEAKGQIKGIQEIPVAKLFFVEAEQGNYLITSDGRFVFEGKMTDVWYRRTISSLEDARAVERTPVDHLGFKPEEQLASFKIGDTEKPRLGVAFIDPTTDYSLQFLKKISDNKELNGHWTVVLMPLIGGTEAVDRSLRLWCSEDAKGAKEDLIAGTSNSFKKMKKGCNDERIVMGMMLTDVFRIKSLPHLIREDGLISDGYPKDFDAWFGKP
jgi:thiol:disulfide interchange protein DsbC